MLGFTHCFDSKQNIHLYGARGSGDDYDDFYRWHNQKKLHYEGSDFPWDYFVYVNEEDRLEFLQKYSNKIFFNENSSIDLKNFYDCTVPYVRGTNEFFDLLNDCIMEEINKEIIAKIKR